MLKAQLHSKFFHIEQGWREAEDILTGDFFGVLDYLPRTHFLADFLRRVCPYRDSTPPLNLEGVEWKNVEFSFWPMTYAHDESAEPDLLLISNRALIVIEVKLDSGLGARQPWREYVVGQQLARERGLSPESVRYLVMARGRPDISATFANDEYVQREELLARSYYIRWCDTVTMIESWLRHGVSAQPLLQEQVRILDDLLRVMRRRRRIAFEGFAFTNQDDVRPPTGRLFCPPSFEGFLTGNAQSVVNLGSTMYLDVFGGFLNRLAGSVAAGRTWPVSTFSGFMQRATRCCAQPTLVF
jgi:hypothetical protein